MASVFLIILGKEKKKDRDAGENLNIIQAKDEKRILVYRFV